MSKGAGNNILANCFKKTTKNVKDFIPTNVQQEYIREQTPIKFPESTDLKFIPDLLPNVLFDEWPSDEEIKNFDFSNGGKQYTDPDSNLIVLPFSLRKETYNSMAWLRPIDYIKQKDLINKIKEKFEKRNFNYIKNKIDIAQSNMLNYDRVKNETEENEDEQDENEAKKELPDINQKDKELGSLNNLKLSIKRRNSIDIGEAEGENNSLGREFFGSKLTEEEKNIYLENKNKQFDFLVVPVDENQDKNEAVEEPAVKQPVAIKGKKNEPEPIQINFNKLKPSDLNLSVALCDYCRWVSSQYQILLDNNINTENNGNHFIRNIYPQDGNGVPKYNPSGMYLVKLYHMGKFRKIIIDDKFPVNKETFDCYLPQCLSPYELWPMILTKAIIKLYSYKYRCDSYNQDEVGDCSILFSLTKYIGIKLPSIKFNKYLTALQQIKNQQLQNNNDNININEDDKDKNKEENDKIDKDKNEQNENEENKVDIIFLNNKKNENKNGYDLLVAYINSNNFKDENQLTNKNLNGYRKKDYNIDTDDISNNNKEQFPNIELFRNKSSIKYSEKTYKLLDIRQNLKNRNKSKKNITKKVNQNIPPEYQLLYEKLNKYSGVSTQKELDTHKRFERYFEEHRFLTNENLYNNYQKYMTVKTNKIFKNGIICDVGYSLLEIFQCGSFNMKRLKPIYFGDMKLDIKIKYKQMTPEEKAIYLDQIKELKIKQKKEKMNRINDYLSLGSNLLCIKFTNDSIVNDNKKAYEIETLYSLREIEAAKLCIKNGLVFPPEQYFETSFIPKLTKDEETGEINFWTKNFYKKLLKNYFKTKEEEKKLLLEEEKRKKKEEEEKNKKENDKKEKESEEKNKNEEKFEENNEEEEEPNQDMLKEFEEQSVKFTEELNNLTEGLEQGTWMRYDAFRDCFDNFILFKNMNSFTNKLCIDNVWYNYDKDLYEEKESSNIIHLVKIDANNNNIDNNSKFFNVMEENELYIIFEPNSEKNKKSISSEIPYQQNEITKKGNKYDDITFSITLSIYEIDKDKKITKLTSLIMKNYFNILNLNISKLSKNSDTSEYFINTNAGLCSFGYHLQLLSNVYTLENYSYNQFLCNYRGFIEKKINIMHPILPKEQYYLMMHLTIEHKKLEDENEKKISKFYTNFIGYDDNVIKNNIEVVLINSITNKKVRIYFRKFFDIDFSKCPKYIVELSIIPPGNIPERNFEYLILYDNPNVNIEIFENITPFYMRQKYIPNKHHIVFNELVFPCDMVTTTLDISLEYRPKPENDSSQNQQNNNSNYTDESLPPEVQFPSKIRMIFYFLHGENTIFNKDFENHTLIRNLLLQGKQINPKEVDTKAIYEANAIKCVLDPDVCPPWLINPNEYKGDVYWRIAVFATESLSFVKNTLKEDKEKKVKESWEIQEPGRKDKAEKSRKKYFVTIKFNNGEMLSPEEEDLIPEKFNRKEIIESTSKTLVTNIPPKPNAKNQPVNAVVENEKKENDEANEIMKKLPKIENYCSLVMKNFYTYSHQNRVITKNKNGVLNSNTELPNINQFCKSPEQREQEVKELEEKVNQYYEDMKKDDEKRNTDKDNYYNQIQEINDKFVEKRQKMITDSNGQTGPLLDQVVEKNNKSLSKAMQIQNLYDLVFQEQNETNEISDEALFEWYNELKTLNNDVNNKEFSLSNKYKTMIEQIKEKLGTLFKTRIEIVLKPETKAKNDLIKQYKNAVDEKIVIFDESKETKALLVKL